MQGEIKLVCAWCNKVLREGEEPASHGICEKCKKEHFPKLHDSPVGEKKKDE